MEEAGPENVGTASVRDVNYMERRNDYCGHGLGLDVCVLLDVIAKCSSNRSLHSVSRFFNFLRHCTMTVS